MATSELKRHVCVHGHFYQPPRENPWLELVEQQPSAYPFHDWNQRITAECYAPNANARILDEDDRITRLVNNYARMSFNIGPTLLAWMEEEDPHTYRAILEADRRSMRRFGGHGSAMAQAYNHAILPLANRRDKRTQIAWGIADFRHRFGREPEGMWLAEAAVDTETLDLMAEQGIRFTVLSPAQAKATRSSGATEWLDVTGGRVDPRVPYTVALPSGRSISVFFYDGPISRAVAFEGLLESGERFTQRLLSGFLETDTPQLVHIATDGESYGHHHRHGEMALAHALEIIRQRPDVDLTNYAQYLELHPPDHEAQIVEDSSWSCAHGIERWRGDCGCTTGGQAGWDQAWRTPLRDALDWLRDAANARSEHLAGKVFRDPWAARDAYIKVVLDRSPESIDDFMATHRADPGADTSTALRLMELQRQLMLMYTSCGWFFEELTRIETIQVLRYAARAAQLVQHIFDEDLETEFLTRLAKAESNLEVLGNGRDLYEREVQPSMADLQAVGAHFAISGLFRRYRGTEHIGCYEVVREDEHRVGAGRAQLAVGRSRIRSTITLAEQVFEFAVLHLGDHNFVCGMRQVREDADYTAMREDLDAAFASADFPEVIRRLDGHFGQPQYSLRTLFRDEQQRILDIVLGNAVEDAEATQRNIYRGRAPLLRFLSELGVRMPPALRSAAEVVINAELREQFSDGTIDPGTVRSLIDEARRLDITLDAEGLAHTLSVTVDRIARDIGARTEDPVVFDRFGREEEAFFAHLDRLVGVSESLPFEVDLGGAQNVAFHVLRAVLPVLRERPDEAAARWITQLEGLALRLNLVPPTEA